MEAGDHGTLLRISHAQCARLMENARHGRFSEKLPHKSIVWGQGTLASASQSPFITKLRKWKFLFIAVRESSRRTIFTKSGERISKANRPNRIEESGYPTELY